MLVDTGKHAEPGDRSFAISVAKHAGAAVALVLVVALAFWAIGASRGGDEVAIEPAPTTDAGSETATTDDGSTDTTSDPADSTGDDPAADPATGDPDGEDPAATASEPAPAASEPAATEPDPEPEPEPAASETEAPSGNQQFAPANVSIQVLDAVLDDDGAAADAYAARARGDGYRVVAVNKAIRVYTTTTVFYTPGNEAKARQVAAQYGFSAVEPAPDNLNPSVDIHLVIGTDYDA